MSKALGDFNIHTYLTELYESLESGKAMGTVENEGIIIPEDNKFYTWLKKTYDKSQVEVKSDMSLGTDKFNPGYDMQAAIDSVKEFKPGMWGEVKVKETKPAVQDTAVDKAKGKDIEETLEAKTETTEEVKEEPKKEIKKTIIKKAEVKSKTK